MIICIVIILILTIYIIQLHLKLYTEKSKAEVTKNQFAVMMNEYITIVEIDLKEDTYELLKVTNEVANLLQSVNSQANFQLQMVMKQVASEAFVDEVLEFVDLLSLEKRFEDRKVLFFDFQGKYNGWCRASFICEDEEKNKVMFMIRQIDNDKLVENQLRFKIENDALTGLHNEDYGIIAIKKKLDTKTAGMFCLMEVDHFKELNDLYGSIVGNQIIVEISNCIKECFKSGDIMIRRGGARFAVFAVDVQDKEDGRFIMKMLESHINVIQILDIKITISAGIAFNRTEDPSTYETLLTNSEMCLKTSRDIDGVSVSYYD